MKPIAFIVNADQRDSRRHRDSVPDGLELVARVPDQLLGFERTAGDEIQAALGSARAVVETVAQLSREPGRWRIGIGLGPVDDLGVPSTRQARGEAYLLAREAVEHARHEPGMVALRAAGSDPRDLRAAESALILLRTVLAQRTAKGWEVVDLMHGVGAEGAQLAVAASLGISASAVSQRLDRAQWRAGLRAGELAELLLGRLATELQTERGSRNARATTSGAKEAR